MTENNIYTFETTEEVARAVARVIAVNTNRQERNKRYYNVALSGGNTPKLLFQILASEFSEKIRWEALRLFWVDERCVPPTDQESNYGMTYQNLLKKTYIPVTNIFRMKGENDPSEEAVRYQALLEKELKMKKGIPQLDLVLLGMGDDGHTASIFPDNLALLHADETVAVARHPVSGQMRITLTGKIIRQARQRIFLITGKSKSNVLNEILKNEVPAQKYLAFHILSLPDTEVYLDREAAYFLG